MIRLRVLDRKLVRDIWHMRSQVAAIAVVVACGVAVVMTTRTSYASLLESRASYYTRYRFADVFAGLKRAPRAVIPRLAAIPGAAEVDTRIVMEVTLDVPGLAEPATGRLVSVPEGGQPRLNRLHLRAGRWIEAGRRDEVIISEAFADANRLTVGDSLGAVINGRWQRLRVVGVALSPEYIYEIGAGGLFPDNRRFGVLWMSEAALAAAFDMVGAFNDVTLALAPGASQGDVVSAVDGVLERYGGLGAYGRGEHVSARFIADEIEQNRVSGTIIPAIFLGVAAFLLNIVLARLVGTEREQIGVLKAFGYGDWTIGGHYLKLAVVVLFVGAVAGIAMGFWFAARVNARYAEFYRFPSFVFRLDWLAVVLSVAITAAAAAIGAAGAVSRVVRLPPAAAMSPEPPPRFRTGVFEWIGLSRRLAVPGRMIARSLERRPVRALLSVTGIAWAAAILMTGRFFVDAMLDMADVQFRYVQRENLTILFARPQSEASRFALARLPGVLQIEPFRAAPVRLRAEHHARRVAVLGLEPGTELRRIIGRARVSRPVPAAGVLLTTKLAEILAVAPGDSVTLEVLEGARLRRREVVAAVVDEPLGLNAYMDRRALNRLLAEGPSLSGAYVRTDAMLSATLFQRLKRLPVVAGVSSRDATLASFETTLARSIGLMTTILVGFAGALAVGMVYNAARIALSERGRELASLRVLGFTRGEVATMLLGEQALLTGVGIATGLALGYGVCAVLSRLYQWELFRIPLFVSVRTYAFAAIVVLAAALVSALLVRRRIDRLDLVAVLKTRE